MNNELEVGYGMGSYRYENREARRKNGQRSGKKISTNPNWKKPNSKTNGGKQK